ncbi:MAG: hypothetical protein JRI25_11775 [Deltaproteobacteria bacterium]|nr:hypothetical protein [Deltaproteobacteria bacterium]
MRPFFRYGLATLGLLVALPLPASQVFVEEMPLDELVSSSPAIAIVSQARPPTSQDQFPVTKRWRTYTPYTYVVHRLVVERIIHDPGNHLQLGKTITVAPGDLEEMYEGHVLYEVHGDMESPIIFTYQGTLAGREWPEQFIVFLRYGTFRERPITAFVVPGAVEDTGELAKIEALLGKTADTPEDPSRTVP